MIYCIPAWSKLGYGFNPARPWQEIDILFADEMTQYLQLFVEHAEPCQLILFHYMPQLNYFLQEYELFGVPYWSLFDVLQDSQGVEQTLFSFRDLNWEADIDFIYTPFLIHAKKGNQKVATVQLGSFGQVIWIDYFSAYEQTHRYQFDGRGFLSSIIYYQKGQAYYQTYYNPAGLWQFRHYLGPDKVEVQINPELENRFSKLIYPDLLSLMTEVWQDYLAQVDNRDFFFLDYHQYQPAQLITLLPKDRLALLGHWQSSLSQDYLEEKPARLLVSDTEKILQKFAGLSQSQLYSTPLSNTPQVSKSTELEQTFVYVLLAQQSFDWVKELLYQLEAYLINHSECLVVLLLSLEMMHEKNKLNALLSAFLSATGLNSNQVKLYYPLTDWDYEEALSQARLVVNLSKNLSLSTQLVTLRRGLPQIMWQESSYYQHLTNAYVIKDLSELGDALSYFLGDLSHWHLALMTCLEQLQYFDGNTRIQQLKEAMS